MVCCILGLIKYPELQSVLFEPKLLTLVVNLARHVYHMVSEVIFTIGRNGCAIVRGYVEIIL